MGDNLPMSIRSSTRGGCWVGAVVAVGAVGAVAVPAATWLRLPR